MPRLCRLRRSTARQHEKVCFRFSRTLQGSEPCLGLPGYRCRVVFGGLRMHFFDIASDRFNSSYKQIKIRLQKEYRLQFPPDHCVWSGLYQIASPNKILAEARVSEIVSRGPIVGVCYCHSFTRLWIAHLCEKRLSCKVLSELQLSSLHRFVAEPHDPAFRLSRFGPTIISQLLLGCGVQFFPSW